MMANWMTDSDDEITLSVGDFFWTKIIAMSLGSILAIYMKKSERNILAVFAWTGLALGAFFTWTDVRFTMKYENLDNEMDDILDFGDDCDCGEECGCGDDCQCGDDCACHSESSENQAE